VNTQTARLRRAAIATTAFLMAAAGLFAGAPAARADSAIDTYDVSGAVAADGTMTIATTMAFTGGAPAKFSQRLATTQNGENYTYYKYDITDVTAKAGTTDLAPKVTTEGDFVVIDVDTSNLGQNPLVIGYTVKGAATSGGVNGSGTAMTAISWPVLQGLPMPVNTASGSIKVPGSILSVNCQSGAPSGMQPCQQWGGGTHDSWSPSFQDAGLKAGDQLVLSFTAPSSGIAVNQQVIQRWTLDRAFSTATGPLLAALIPLLVGAGLLFWLWRRLGLDVGSSKEPTLVASFVPTGKGTVEFQVDNKIRPGHVGTVVDEHVDPVDITATVLDLAVRGHLQIIEMKPQKGPADWTFKRLASADEMRPFEKTLLDGIAPETGEATTVSQIGPAVENVITEVQRDLYEEVVDRGWFAHRPDQTRHTWDLIGWISLAAAIIALVLLVIFTHFGLLGLVLVALAVGLLAIAQTMPRRTQAGVDMLHGLHALSMSLQTQPTNQIPKDQAYDQISRVLPYAVVLGGRGRWMKALADADEDPDVPDPEDLSWYHGPADWNMSNLPVSLDAFVANMSGRLLGRD